MQENMHYLIWSELEGEGKILTNFDEVMNLVGRQYTNVAKLKVTDGRITIQYFMANFERKMDVSVEVYASMTSNYVLKKWFGTRSQFPSFASWIASVSEFHAIEALG